MHLLCQKETADREEEKGIVLFVNKKNQKNFVTGCRSAGASEIPRYRGIADVPAVLQPRDKVFFGSFLFTKKNTLSF